MTKGRGRAADLAHGLKTPLVALGAQARKLRAAGQGAIADGFDRAIASATATVEREMARSRVAAVRAGAPVRSGTSRRICWGFWSSPPR